MRSTSSLVMLCLLFLVACTSQVTPPIVNVTPNFSEAIEEPRIAVPADNVTVDEDITKVNTSIPEKNATVLTFGNLVEFYLAPFGGAYIKHFLREGENKTYNMSGTLVRVEPVIISQDGVIIRINNVSSRALVEKESERVNGFDLYIDDIYTR